MIQKQFIALQVLLTFLLLTYSYAAHVVVYDAPSDEEYFRGVEFQGNLTSPELKRARLKIKFETQGSGVEDGGSTYVVYRQVEGLSLNPNTGQIVFSSKNYKNRSVVCAELRDAQILPVLGRIPVLNKITPTREAFVATGRCAFHIEKYMNQHDDGWEVKEEPWQRVIMTIQE